MAWLQLRFDTAPDHAAELEDALLAAGASAVTMEDNADQPVLEPGVNERPLWQHTRVTGLFPADTQLGPVLAALELIYSHTLPTHYSDILEDKDWEREWIERFKPIQCGDRLWICPSWCEPAEPEAVNLYLDPGLAFGTGTHPTTFLCLQWLDKQSLVGKTVIDYGCGSGILGIAALLLGAERVIAVDNDPQALVATRDNAERNNIAAEKISCYLPDALPAESHADILLANILAEPLQQLAPTLTELTAAGGLIALSGLLSEQGDTVQACYSDGFEQWQRAEHEGWLRLNATRCSNT